MSEEQFNQILEWVADYRSFAEKSSKGHPFGSPLAIYYRGRHDAFHAVLQMLTAVKNDPDQKPTS